MKGSVSSNQPVSKWMPVERARKNLLLHPSSRNRRGPSLRTRSSHREASSPFHDSEKARPAMHSEASKVAKGIKALAKFVLFFPSCSAEKARRSKRREVANNCPHLLHRNRGFYTTYPPER